MTEASTANRPRDEGTPPSRTRTDNPGSGGDLITPKGTTSIESGVVAKIAGMAAREIEGVHAMGTGGTRALGAVRGMVGGGDRNVTQGVAVEVGERQAAVDIDLVVEYGVAIPDLAGSVRRNVISAVERMTGLEVTEVNIRVDDVHLPEPERPERERESEQEARVR